MANQRLLLMRGATNMTDLTTEAGILEWARPSNDPWLIQLIDAHFPCPRSRHDRATAARMAENERLRQAFENILEFAAAEAKELHAEGLLKTTIKFAFPYDDFGVARDIIEDLRAALDVPK